MSDVRLEDVPEGDRLYEIVNGTKVWLPLRSTHTSAVARRFVDALNTYGDNCSRGEVYVYMPYEVPVGGKTVRRPVGSFVSRGRLDARGPIPPEREGNPVVPELVVEVLGAGDLAEDMQSKIGEYLRAGVSLVWVVYPKVRTLHAYSDPSAVRAFTESDTLDAGDVLPGFTVPMAGLFPAEGRPADKLRMYILIRESVPAGFAVLAAAHASLAAYLRFRDTPEVDEWLSGPFYKTVCKVTDDEFARAKDVADHVVMTESALGGQEVAIAFRPRAEYPKMFRFLKLYK
jgi:Uma2 family endonuclease